MEEVGKERIIKDDIMKFGVWIHEKDLSLEDQIITAKRNGIHNIRSYTLEYSTRVAPILNQYNMSLLAGIHVNAQALAADWRSQIRLEELEKTLSLGVELEAICVGNELRQGGDDPKTKNFSARLSFGLANLLDTYRQWMDEHGFETPLTYAMEGIVFNRRGIFHEWLWPLIDSLDIVSVNLYPMGVLEWHGWGAFDRSREFLTENKIRNDRLVKFEMQLRSILNQLESINKPMILTETGFPSAVDYNDQGNNLIIPINENDLFFSAMKIFLRRIHSTNKDYKNRIKALYFYEWRDNLYHSKIWNVEQSPIHVAFGLCDHNGFPKFDIRKLLVDQTV